jgi:putative DNA primase/helicase
MAKLGRVFDVASLPTLDAARPVAPPESQLIDAMRAAGITHTPEQIHIDGKMHRFCTSGKRGDSGWYIIFADGIPAGQFGCWRSGLVQSWRADVGRKISHVEQMAHTRRMAEAAALREAELARRRETAADVVGRIWSEAQAASPEHPYLQRKGIATHGARVTGDGRLIVPLYSPDGELVSLQYIDSGSDKKYHPGGQTGGAYWWLGALEDAKTIYIAEGFATAATIHQTTGQPVFIAYSASNLVPVCGMLRQQFGASQSLVIVADNDASHTGQKYADQASAKYGARVVVPPIEGMDANDYMQAGHNLGALLTPQREDGWLIPADDFSAQPAPISWLVKHWIQKDALIMVHGPSGGGKTFVVLDWCLRMASGMAEWCGQKVKPGRIVYLAGEGHHGLRGRIAAWKHRHQAGSLSMWLSRDGCDLNTAEGYLKVVEQVRALGYSPEVIVVDTLHRFLSGDENSAQDAKTMLDACNRLMSEFGCSVVLVHHTGVSDEAQHRARGSSAWRGALDIEISIVPGKEGVPMQIVQRKSKDAELAETIHVELQQVAIPGWRDEDDQQVTSAVIVQAQAPIVAKKDSKIDSHRKTFENAWWGTGAEEREGLPYISRSALKDKLAADGRKPRTIENDLSPAYPEKLIGALILAELISPLEHGWVVVDNVQSSAMMMRKGGKS